ncbi:cohesin subunit SA-1-like isoform X2 [Physella acuta]|uniref:cohesin subunit SA-1-like isoform X2 n=1 Tax=Physella acuta TaxID=109671 RepID=UPI0027DC3EA0|nr:cohesin subunit SA-1-like isoform X2 [Physella acuta]
MPAGRPRRATKQVAPTEVDESEQPSELSLHQDDSDSDFEEPKVKGKRKKKDDSGAPAKRKKTETKANKRAQLEAQNQVDGSLFETVKAGKASLQAVVDDWIEGYKLDRNAALLELIQFFIQCSGCKGKITPFMYANMEHAEIIRKMTEEFDEESGDYPLIMTGPQWKKFKSSYCEFVQVLVRQCQYSIIYDQYMMDNVISLLTGLTDSQVRAFRHTSTLAAMKLMTALVDVALNLSINLDNTQRQYESERAKQQNKRAGDRLDLLMQKRQELEENQAEIRNMLTYIFKGVFVHRYRDTQPEIRSICMAEIGVWMKKYPNMFLDDSYLKYVGWTLYDKVGEVRLCCLKTLAPLHETPDLSGKLELFTNRFKDRIVEMTLDKESDVAVQAIRLVICVLKYSENVLSDKDCENVYELVYSSNRSVAQAAGDFLNHKLFKRDDEAPPVRSANGKKRSPNTPLVRDLVQFFIESELHEHAAYLVDSLWEINEMMKDWECMTDLLLEEPGKGEEALDDKQETSLIEIMVCCVKQAATGDSPIGRGPNKKMSAKEVKQVSEDKQRLTEHFIVALPQLLLKYLMDAEKVANLLQIPLYFDLDIYTSGRQEKNLELLLRYINDIVEKHTGSEVLEACSKCLECLCNEEFAIAGKSEVSKKTLIDALVIKLKQAVQDYFTEGDTPDEDEVFALLAALKRIGAFYACHDLTNWEVWEDIFIVVKSAKEKAPIPEEIIVKAIQASALAVMFYFKRLDETKPRPDEMKRIRKKLALLMLCCHELMFHESEKVKEEAYVTICDLLIVFSPHLAEINLLLKPVVYDVEPKLTAHLGEFLQMKVFVEDDDDDMDENVKIEELHKRRNFLASFCKLVVYNIVHIKVAATMFKHYMKFYNDYGDIIKWTLSKAREINKVTTSKTLAISLQQLFKELQAEHGDVDRSSDAFQSIKELSRRFALSFGLDQIKNREAVATMHTEGIMFSLTPFENFDKGPNAAPPNLAFLEVLCEFTNKLMKQDKKTVVNYLDKQVEGKIPQVRQEDWQPFFTYRNSLMQGETDWNPITLKQAAQKRYGRKNRQDTSSDTSYEPHTPGPMSVQPMTSTAVKRGHHHEQDEDSNMESNIGSEQDFDDSSSRSAQANWSHKAPQQEHHNLRRSDRHRHPPATPQLSEISDNSIGEFESPSSVHHHQQRHHHHQQQQQQQQFYYQQQHHHRQSPHRRALTPQQIIGSPMPPGSGTPHTPVSSQGQGHFYQAQGGLFEEDSSQYIEDASSDMSSHQGY